MTRTADYGRRIAEGAARDGVPRRLSRPQALALCRRYGAAVRLSEGEQRLADVAAAIAAELLREDTR